MIESILYEIGKQKWLFVIDFAVVLLICLYFLIGTRRFSWKKGKVKLFGFLYNLSGTQAACVGLLIARACFIFTSTIYFKNIGLGHFAVILISSLMIGVISKNIGSILSGLLFSFSTFFLLYIEMSLYNFYLTYEKSILVLLMVVLIAIFVLLNMAHSTIKSYEDLLDMNTKKMEKQCLKELGNEQEN